MHLYKIKIGDSKRKYLTKLKFWIWGKGYFIEENEFSKIIEYISKILENK